MAAIFIVLIYILPLILAGFWLNYFLAKRREGLALGGTSFLIMLILGIWTIFQSRSSTAAIGLIFLPAYACLCGLLGWLFARFKNHSKPFVRVFAWIMLIVNLTIFGLWLRDAYLQKLNSNERDRAQAFREEKIKENRKLIQTKLIEFKNHEPDWLNPEILSREKDELFLIPALESSFVKPEVLEKLSHSEFSSVILMVARNPVTSSQTLAGIYANSSDNSYYHQDLATHKNTPVVILRKLYENSKPHLPVEKWLAENPSTPKDILLKISQSKEVVVLMSLMKNEVVDCELSSSVQTRLNGTNLVDTYKYLDQLRTLVREFNAKNCQK